MVGIACAIFLGAAAPAWAEDGASRLPPEASAAVDPHEGFVPAKEAHGEGVGHGDGDDGDAHIPPGIVDSISLGAPPPGIAVTFTTTDQKAKVQTKFLADIDRPEVDQQGKMVNAIELAMTQRVGRALLAEESGDFGKTPDNSAVGERRVGGRALKPGWSLEAEGSAGVEVTYELKLPAREYAKLSPGQYPSPFDVKTIGPHAALLLRSGLFAAIDVTNGYGLGLEKARGGHGAEDSKLNAQVQGGAGLLVSRQHAVGLERNKDGRLVARIGPLWLVEQTFEAAVAAGPIRFGFSHSSERIDGERLTVVEFEDDEAGERAFKWFLALGARGGLSQEHEGIARVGELKWTRRVDSSSVFISVSGGAAAQGHAAPQPALAKQVVRGDVQMTNDYFEELTTFWPGPLEGESEAEVVERMRHDNVELQARTEYVNDLATARTLYVVLRDVDPVSAANLQETFQGERPPMNGKSDVLLAFTDAEIQKTADSAKTYMEAARRYGRNWRDPDAAGNTANLIYQLSVAQDPGRVLFLLGWDAGAYLFALYKGLNGSPYTEDNPPAGPLPGTLKQKPRGPLAFSLDTDD